MGYQNAESGLFNNYSHIDLYRALSGNRDLLFGTTIYKEEKKEYISDKDKLLLLEDVL